MDILNKFANFELKQEDKIPKEDIGNCKKIQSEYENILAAYKKWYDIYHKTLQSTVKHDYCSLKVKDLSICKTIRQTHENFIYQIYDYFSSKYKVDLENIFTDKTDFDYNYENYTINTEPLNYKVYVDDILRQLDGLSFKDMRIKQLKEKIKSVCQNTYKDEWKIDIKGSVIKFKDLVCSNGMCWCDCGKFYILEPALSWFEFNKEIKFKQFDFLRNSYSIKWEYINSNIELNTGKIKLIKIFKNGRVDVKFSSPETAREFISDWCAYPLSDAT